jgi:hypothetical protein
MMMMIIIITLILAGPHDLCQTNAIYILHINERSSVTFRTKRGEM